ncbi:DgyrCDS8456 [Dimorphilus gyrociliatus]|uniref:DgyrCDS8456 n=1 Tax=Dimorphilus gyrociliatus TaxID=2664684 RepID=A0A7I8VU94_9ANNE|nr:DgyrCDS8456 [Dimorphilus gyrociliatus]
MPNTSEMVELNYENENARVILYCTIGLQSGKTNFNGYAVEKDQKLTLICTWRSKEDAGKSFKRQLNIKPFVEAKTDQYVEDDDASFHIQLRPTGFIEDDENIYQVDDKERRPISVSIEMDSDAKIFDEELSIVHHNMSRHEPGVWSWKRFHRKTSNSLDDKPIVCSQFQYQGLETFRRPETFIRIVSDTIDEKLIRAAVTDNPILLAVIKAFEVRLSEATVINIDEIIKRQFEAVLFKPNSFKEIVYNIDIETPSRERQKYVTIVSEQTSGIINTETVPLTYIVKEDSSSFEDGLQVVNKSEDSLDDNEIYIMVSEIGFTENKVLLKILNPFKYFKKNLKECLPTHASNFISVLSWVLQNYWISGEREDGLCNDNRTASFCWRRTSTPMNKHMWNERNARSDGIDLGAIWRSDLKNDIAMDTENQSRGENEFWTEDFGIVELRNSAFTSEEVKTLPTSIKEETFPVVVDHESLRAESVSLEDAVSTNLNNDHVVYDEREQEIDERFDVKVSPESNFEEDLILVNDLEPSLIESLDDKNDSKIPTIKIKEELGGTYSILSETDQENKLVIENEKNTSIIEGSNSLKQSFNIDESANSIQQSKEKEAINIREENLIINENPAENNDKDDNAMIQDNIDDKTSPKSPLALEIKKEKKNKRKFWKRNHKPSNIEDKSSREDSKRRSKKRNLLIKCLIGGGTNSSIDLSRQEVKVNEEKKQSVIELIDKIRSEENILKPQSKKSNISMNSSKTSIKSKRSQALLSNRQRSMGSINLLSQKEREEKEQEDKKKDEEEEKKKVSKSNKKKFFNFKPRKIITKHPKKSDLKKRASVRLSEGSRTVRKARECNETEEALFTMISQGSQTAQKNPHSEICEKISPFSVNEPQSLREDIVNEIERRIIQEATLHKYLALWRNEEETNKRMDLLSEMLKRMEEIESEMMRTSLPPAQAKKTDLTMTVFENSPLQDLYKEFINDRSKLKAKYDMITNNVQKQAVLESVDEIIKSYTLFKKALEAKIV